MQWVAKVHVESEADLNTFMSELKTASNVAALSSSDLEFRCADRAEADAVADVLASLRDSLGVSARVTYHACRHDEGVGFCTGIVEK